MSGIIGSISRKIELLTKIVKPYNSDRGHPGANIAPLLSRKIRISDTELKEKKTIIGIKIGDL